LTLLLKCLADQTARASLARICLPLSVAERRWNTSVRINYALCTGTCLGRRRPSITLSPEPGWQLHHVTRRRPPRSQAAEYLRWLFAVAVLICDGPVGRCNVRLSDGTLSYRVFTTTPTRVAPVNVCMQW